VAENKTFPWDMMTISLQKIHAASTPLTQTAEEE